MLFRRGIVLHFLHSKAISQAFCFRHLDDTDQMLPVADKLFFAEGVQLSLVGVGVPT